MNFDRNKLQKMNRILCCLALMAISAMGAYAQNGTNSPYSQYGLGDMADQGVGFNKGMSGVGLAFRKGNEVNPLNPASYSSVDSLSTHCRAVLIIVSNLSRKTRIKDHAQ